MSDSVLEKSCCTIESLIRLLNLLSVELSSHQPSALFFTWQLEGQIWHVCECVGISRITGAIPAQNTSVVAWQCDWVQCHRGLFHTIHLYCSFVCRFVLLIFFHDNKRMFYHVAWNKLTEIFIWKVTCVHVLADFFFFF